MMPFKTKAVRKVLVDALVDPLRLVDLGLGCELERRRDERDVHWRLWKLKERR
jgi:hypothetical protein